MLPIPLNRDQSGGPPPGSDALHPIPAIAPRRRGSSARARDRDQPRDRPVLVEPVRADVHRRGPSQTDGPDARMSALAVVFVKINGERHYLRRAVDHESEVLESYVTK
jgi:hypothetical protein